MLGLRAEQSGGLRTLLLSICIFLYFMLTEDGPGISHMQMCASWHIYHYSLCWWVVSTWKSGSLAPHSVSLLPIGLVSMVGGLWLTPRGPRRPTGSGLGLPTSLPIRWPALAARVNGISPALTLCWILDNEKEPLFMGFKVSPESTRQLTFTVIQNELITFLNTFVTTY